MYLGSSIDDLFSWLTMKKGPSTDRVIGLSAMLISLMTLIIFLYQTNLIKNQSRLSVRPRLTFSKNIDKTFTVDDADSTTQAKVRIRLKLRNNGLGPAIIESCMVIDKGESYELMSFFQEVYPELFDYGFFSQVTDFTTGEAIPASESIFLFSYEFDSRYENEINSIFNTQTNYEFPFEFMIIYSSMYGEKWQILSETEGHPTPLD